MSVKILIGDVREQLDAMPDESVDVVVTSPPYWGLRDYDVDGQIGLEPTLGEHLDVMVDVFRRIRRVLKPTGMLWINYGDCYATSPNGRSAAATKAAGNDDRTFRDKPFSTVGPIYVADYEKTARGGASENLGNTSAAHGGRIMAGGRLKPKDLCMIPNRLAIALQDDGWWVRAECIWGKPNAMPDSSGAQRPSVAHEKVFLFSKSEDADIWRARDTGELSFAPDLTERCALVTDPDRTGPRWIRIGAYYDANEVLQGRASDEDARTYRGGSYVGGEPGPRAVTGNRKVDFKTNRKDGPKDGARKNGRSRSIDPRHDGHINHTGIQEVGRGEGRYLRNYEPAPLTVWEIAIEPFKGQHFATFPTELVRRCLKATCPPGGHVLDPFGGAGTTALVADRMGLDCTLIELSPEYAEIATKRLKSALCREVQGAPIKPITTGLPLFGEVA